jgi:hypothetical protein
VSPEHRPVRPVSLAQIVRRAVEIVDPDDDDPVLGGFEEDFEDADEPIAGELAGLEERVARSVAGNTDNPRLAMAEAMVLYLAHRRDEVDADPDHILRLSARAEWDGDPPAHVREWLAEREISI